jgi:hypothetical protein
MFSGFGLRLAALLLFEGLESLRDDRSDNRERNKEAAQRRESF